MAGALLFLVPFVAITLTGPNSASEVFTTIIALLLTWSLPLILFLRHRMKYINRRWSSCSKTFQTRRG